MGAREPRGRQIYSGYSPPAEHKECSAFDGLRHRALPAATLACRRARLGDHASMLAMPTCTRARLRAIVHSCSARLAELDERAAVQLDAWLPSRFFDFSSRTPRASLSSVRIFGGGHFYRTKQRELARTTGKLRNGILEREF